MTKTIKQIRETTIPIGSAPRRNPHKEFSKSSLGGRALRARAGAQKAGNQLRKDIDEEIVKEVLKKVKGNKTDTGKKSNSVDTEPEHKNMTGYN